MLKRIDEEKFPRTDEIFSWVKDMTAFGHRKTGTEEGKKSAEYIRDKFKEFGLTEVEIEKAKSMCMFVDNYGLEVDGEKIESMYANGTNRGAEEGQFKFDKESEFVYLGKGLEEDFKNIDIKGKIVVCDIYFKQIDLNDMLAMLKEEAGNFITKRLIYDPDKKLKTTEPILDIYSPNNWPYNYFYSQQSGAAGFVGILQDYVDDPNWYSEDYTFYGEEMGIDYMKLPGMWISKSSGEALKKKFTEQKILKGKMQMTSRYEYKDALNVKGIIKGESDEIVLCHSHHDAVYAGGVQDASGMSEVLALAKYFANPENKKSEKTYMFGAMDTHFTDYNGHEAFISERKKKGDNILYDFSIEHIGKEANIEDGKFVLTGEGVPKMLYVSMDKELIKNAIKAVKRHDLRKTLVLPVEHREDKEFTDDDNVISDANLFEMAGIKIVSLISAPSYLFHPSDTADMVMTDWLVPIGLMYGEMMEAVK
jgi:hypothetical protein